MNKGWKSLQLFLIWNTDWRANFGAFMIIFIIQGTLISVYMIYLKHDCPIMWATYIIKIFLVAILKELEKTSETDFNTIFYSKCKWYNTRKIFYIFWFCLWNPVCNCTYKRPQFGRATFQVLKATCAHGYHKASFKIPSPSPCFNHPIHVYLHT